jgi:cobalt-zinc-cadmium efflux system protein
MPHGHAHAHAGHDHHGHDHGRSAGAGHAGHAAGAASLRLAFFINLAFTVVEALGGWWTGSIAVLADALHDAGDCLVLGLAWWLQRVALRGRDAQYSYGYGRYSMLGGWLASVVLIVGALSMLGIAVLHLGTPEIPNATGMIGIALFGLVMNGLAAWQLHGGASLNERGAYLHLLEDVLGWAAVLLGAVTIRYTGWAVVDPLLSIGISLFILWNAVKTLRRGTGILMQEIPAGIDMQAIRTRLMAIPHVVDLHDQHTWTLDGSLVVHTVHVVVADVDLPQARTIKHAVRTELGALGIRHATIELEWADEHCALEHH